METGVVTLFKPSEEQLYGFIEGEKGSVFFHHSRRHEPTCDGGDTPVLNGWINKRFPQKGDVLICEVEVAGKGPRAKWWAFKDEYDAALKAIAERLAYRMIEHQGPEKRGRLTPVGYRNPEIRWTGKNLASLRIAWSRNVFPVLQKPDFRRWFEVCDGDGNWTLTNDPR